MRSGRLLAEESPDILMAYYNLSSLEDVFLRLCMKQSVNDGVEQLEIMSNAITSNESPPQIVALTQQQSGEHDNMAFDYSINEMNESENDIDVRNRKNGLDSLVTPIDTSPIKNSQINTIKNVIKNCFLAFGIQSS